MPYTDPDERALCAPYTGRNGVLDRASDATATRMMRNHWGKPANIAQSLALLAQWDAQLTQERIQRSHEKAQKAREKARKARRKAA